MTGQAMEVEIVDPGHGASGAQGLCGATKRSGGTCGNRAGFKTDHVGYGRCHLHGGSTRNHRASAKAAQAADACHRFGISVEVDPSQALLEEVHRSAGLVAFYEAQVMDAEEENELTVRTMFGEQPSVWVKLLAEERDRKIKVAATCVKLGLDERRVQLAEREGQLLANVLRGVLADLGVTNHPDAAAVVRKHLALAAAAA